MPLKPAPISCKWQLPVFAIALVLAAAGLLATTVNILLLSFAGLLFGIFLNALTRLFVVHSPLNYRWAYAVVVLTLAVLAGAGLYFMGSQAAQRAGELRSQLASSLDDLAERLDEQSWLKQMVPEPEKLDDRLLSGIAAPQVMQGLRGVTWVGTALLVILFLGFYVALDPELYESGLVQLAAPRRRQSTRELLHRLRVGLVSWVVGRLLSMTVVGVLTALGLLALNVPLAVPLGVLAALLTFIPNLGPLLAAVPQMLLALEQGPQTVLWVAALNVALQTLESYLITPLIQSKQASLPPALTIVAQLLLGVWVGVIGVATAAPLVIAAMIVVKTTYLQQGDSDATDASDAAE